MTDFSETLRFTWTGPGSASLSDSITKTSQADGGVSVAITASQANLHITPIGIRAGGLQLLFVKTTTCTVHIYTNDPSGGSPDDDFIVAPGNPTYFLAGGTITNPFSVDVTDIYVTETGAVDGTLDMRWLQDVTP